MNRLKVVMEAMPGEDLHQCKLDAIKACAEVDLLVEFEHNSHTFRVNPASLIATVQQVQE